MFSFFNKKKDLGILSDIASQVRKRVEKQKEMAPQKLLFSQNPKPRKAHDFTLPFRAPGVHIISEIKLASPSEGAIAPHADPLFIAKGYIENGARAISVLTERDFFQGHLDYLTHIRHVFADAHLLMKDFVIDEYQLAQAHVYGADAVLLITALLSQNELHQFYAKALELGLTPLVEVHDLEEYRIAKDLGAKLIGVNNRNLKTMEISLKISEEIGAFSEKGSSSGKEVLICESGIKTGADIKKMQGFGFNGFLIGTHFMKQENPGLALRQILEEVQNA